MFVFHKDVGVKHLNSKTDKMLQSGNKIYLVNKQSLTNIFMIVCLVIRLMSERVNLSGGGVAQDGTQKY